MKELHDMSIVSFLQEATEASDEIREEQKAMEKIMKSRRSAKGKIRRRRR